MSCKELEFERVKLEYILTCVSDLHIGNGMEGRYTLKGKSDKNNPELFYNDICFDESKAAYIPASTLRGYLARKIRLMCNEVECKAILGDARQDDTSSSGKMRVYDAFFHKENGKDRPDTELITRTAIEPITNTSKDGQLFTYKVIKPNNKFLLKIELDKVNKCELEIIVNSLAYIDGSTTAQLGRNKSLMMGRLKISEIMDDKKNESLSVKVISKEKFLSWLNVAAGLKNIEFDNIYENYKCSEFTKHLNRSSFNEYKLTLLPLSPLLINDAHKVEAKSDLIFTSNDNYLKIPASTLKGAIRAQCRKILLTLLHYNDNQQDNYKRHKIIANDLLNELFGSTQQMASIRITNAVSSEEAIIHEQTFNAIDRFTGGTADSALYDVQAAVVNELSCTIFINKNLFTNEWIEGLLLLVLRDGTEGDFKIGWGKAKGYGLITIGVEIQSSFFYDWSDILEEIGKEKVISKVNSLNKKLASYNKSLLDNSKEKEAI